VRYRNPGSDVRHVKYECNSLAVSPNPSHDFISLQSDCSDPISEIKVFNIMGEEVLIASANDINRVDVSGLKTGLYVIYTFDKNNSYLQTSKFIKRD
jgi:hypothetical protein